MKKTILLLSLLLAACGSFDGGKRETASGEAPRNLSGTITMKAYSAAFIGSGQGGTGTLYFRGKAYPFTVGGLGIGGIGVSSIDATGEVYDLERVADFPGAYGQVRYGAVAADQSVGQMWLKNPNGVTIHLDTKREGLMLSLGADGMVITLNE